MDEALDSTALSLPAKSEAELPDDGSEPEEELLLSFSVAARSEYELIDCRREALA